MIILLTILPQIYIIYSGLRLHDFYRVGDDKQIIRRLTHLCRDDLARLQIVLPGYIVGNMYMQIGLLTHSGATIPSGTQQMGATLHRTDPQRLDLHDTKIVDVRAFLHGDDLPLYKGLVWDNGRHGSNFYKGRGIPAR